LLIVFAIRPFVLARHFRKTGLANLRRAPRRAQNIRNIRYGSALDRPILCGAHYNAVNKMMTRRGQSS